MQQYKMLLRIGAFLLIALLLPVACKKQAAEEEGELPETLDEEESYYVDLGEDKDVFLDVKERYAPGETVELKTYTVMDATPVVTADGERLSPRSEENGLYLIYAFTMPDHDVSVTYEITGSDMERRFSITYEGDVFRVIDPVYDAIPSETVTVKLGLIFDVITNVRVNGKAAAQTDGPDSDYLYYEFEMPAEDVVVQVESNNISVVESEPIIMVDYCETAVAVDDPDSAGDSYELVLYDDQNTELLLIEYRKDGTEMRYRVPQSALMDLLDVIYGARMDQWNEMEDTTSLDGMLYVCRFNSVGTYYRATSEKMPENGTEAFSEIRAILSSYASEGYRE